jgi:hypothetical protein
MKAEKSAKGFDVLSWLREVRDQIAEETRDLSSQERVAYIREKARVFDALPEVQAAREKRERGRPL